MSWKRHGVRSCYYRRIREENRNEIQKRLGSSKDLLKLVHIAVPRHWLLILVVVLTESSPILPPPLNITRKCRHVILYTGHCASECWHIGICPPDVGEASFK
jgi:hypothetical protein